MTPSELLNQAVDQSVLTGHDGRSGAGLEHVRLADGSEYIIKRVTPASDLTLALTGGTVAREYLLWQLGCPRPASARGRSRRGGRLGRG